MPPPLDGLRGVAARAAAMHGSPPRASSCAEASALALAEVAHRLLHQVQCHFLALCFGGARSAATRQVVGASELLSLISDSQRRSGERGRLRAMYSSCDPAALAFTSVSCAASCESVTLSPARSRELVALRRRLAARRRRDRAHGGRIQREARDTRRRERRHVGVPRLMPYLAASSAFATLAPSAAPSERFSLASPSGRAADLLPSKPHMQRARARQPRRRVVARGSSRLADADIETLTVLLAVGARPLQQRLEGLAGSAAMFECACRRAPFTM